MIAALPSGEDTAGLDFDTLRREGIAALQRLSGAQWTDFNVHDPGVTILEQLVYSLTDLAYRTGFEMADYLTGADGTIDHAALALYPPEAILPPEALTADDYRRLLYGAEPGIGDIWIRPQGLGLLGIEVMASAEALPDPADAPLTLRVRRLYAAHRALCEDLAPVREVMPRAHYLRGEIETAGDSEPALVLAQILYECGEYLSSGMRVRRLRDLVAQGRLPEEVFDGPATLHGHVTARPAAMEEAAVTVSELIGVIQRVPGVRRIRSLAIVDDQLRTCHGLARDRVLGTCPVLAFPDAEATLELLRLQPEQGIEYGVSEQVVPPTAAARAANRQLYDDARLEYAKLRFERSAFRADEGQARTGYPFPAGQFRDLRSYYSVQHEFPAVYGIGKYGLPASAGPERRAQAAQLQGFLYPMEQLMANYLQNLQDLPTLFSVAGDDRRTCFAQHLEDGSLPGIAQLYADGPLPVRERVHQALARHDDYFGRKGRVLDYLLALYGETFPQAALKRFNHYHPADTEAWLLASKRRLLVALVELGARRGCGCDYTLPLEARGAVAPLAWRVSILLGFEDGERYRSLCPQRHGKALALREEAPDGDPPPLPEAWLAVPPPRGLPGAAVPGLVPDDAPMGEALFRGGATLSSYRLGRDGGAYLLHVQAGPRWHLLGRFAQRAEAVATAHSAMAELAALNSQCEGLHVVEHVLLRPPVPGDDTRHGPHGNPAFYAARISVVLPGWTLRCADRAFRNLAEQTVREHCPAHVQPAFLWLGVADMARFEVLHGDWRQALRTFHLAADGAQATLADTLHATGAALVTFLRLHGREPT